MITTCKDKETEPIKLNCRICGKEIDPRFIPLCTITSYGIYCSDCEDMAVGQNLSEVNSYSYKPSPVFIGDIINEDEFYFGMEWEINNISPCKVALMTHDFIKKRYCYLKSDSSICNGVELVTVPMSEGVIKSFLDYVGNRAPQLVGDSPRLFYNAGIHFHIDRNKIKPMTLYKLAWLFSSSFWNTNLKSLYFCTGRVSTSVKINGTESRIKSILYCDLNNAIPDKSIKNIVKHPNRRHVAINFNNSNTIEFRLFKSTLDTEMIKAYIDFVKATVKYCDNTRFKNLNPKDYLLYVRDNISYNKLKRKITTAISKIKDNVSPVVYCIRKIKDILSGGDEFVKSLLKVHLATCNPVVTISQLLYKGNESNGYGPIINDWVGRRKITASVELTSYPIYRKNVLRLKFKVFKRIVGEFKKQCV